MIVNAPLGNAISDKLLAAKFRSMKAAGRCETLYLSRYELGKFRLRRTTDKGTEVRIILDQSSPLRNGDVLIDSKKRFVLIEQLPELVISATIRPRTNIAKVAEVTALLAHNIGNKHRPMSVSERVISFPAVAESELETFIQLTKPLGKYVKVTISRRHFESDSLEEVHEHATQL